jgi:site-specific DNA-methyltransferase (adenine-specific)
MKTDLLDLRNMDCMELMAEFPDKHFDLAIVDPPYGIGNFSRDSYTSKGGKGPRVKNETSWNLDYDWNTAIPDEAYFEEMCRVSVRQIIWGANYYPNMTGGMLVWYKGDQARTVSQAEIAYLSWQNRVDHAHINWQPGFYRKQFGEQIHPCQKPVKLYDWLLRNYAKPGDRILDTHMGSGSIAIACHYAGHHLTASELDPDYFKAACERIERETAQPAFL